MRGDHDLGRALQEIPVPDETAAEERGWEIVSAAYAERAPVRRQRTRQRLALAVAAGGLLVVLGLSPAGAKVGDWVEDVVGIGKEEAKPALRSLPAAGEVLVESEQGVWIVREDGSKRLLGDYAEGTWSPQGLYAAVTHGRQLVAVDPLGNVRWTIDAPHEVRDPVWSPSGFRIAYRSGGDLRVVAGDGTGDRLVARNVAPVAPIWRRTGPAKLSPSATESHVLSWLNTDGDVRTTNVDTGARAEPGGQLPSSGSGSLSPDGGAFASVRHRAGREQLVLSTVGERPTVLFSDPSRMTGPAWSPNGEWLLVGLPQADQWVFIRADGPGQVIAIGRISEQFDPGGAGEGEFPRVAGWIVPER